MAGVCSARDFRPLFEPRSVAVVGASNDRSKWGGDVSVRLLDGSDRRSVYLVNGRGGEILGRPAYVSLRDLPEEPELVILTMPTKFLEVVVEDCVAAGVKAVVAVTAMLGEMGREGKAREEAAARRLRDAGAMLVGPNCLGVADTTSDLNAVAYLDVCPGAVGLISQSGGFAEELNLRLAEFHQGFSRFVAIGNQADVTIPEVLASFVGHTPTRAVAVYAEELRDGRGFARAAQDLVESGTDVVLLNPGRSDASTRVARTHTGSLTSDSVVMDAACRAAGVIRVNTPREAAETLVALLGAPRPKGLRVAVVSDGGGPGAICADLASLAGLSIPEFSKELQVRLGDLLPKNAGRGNPIDFAAATYDPEAYERVVAAVADCGEVDAIVASGVVGFWGARSPEQTDMVEKERQSLLRMAESVKASGKPLLASTSEESPIVEDLRAGGLPLYRDVESAVAGLARLVTAAQRPLGVPDALPPSKPELTSEGYCEAKRTLIGAGIPLVRACRVEAADTETACARAEAIGYPVVVKTSRLLHKSDAGGVVLDIDGPEALIAAIGDLRDRLGTDADELAVERMVPLGDGVELILGCHWDARFGCLLTLGIGGIYTELLADTQTSLAPVDERVALRLLQGLKGAVLLRGARGRPPLDVEAAASAAASLSRFAAAHPEIAAVEINPLLVLPAGAIGLDARLVLSDVDTRCTGAPRS